MPHDPMMADRHRTNSTMPRRSRFIKTFTLASALLRRIPAPDERAATRTSLGTSAAAVGWERPTTPPTVEPYADWATLPSSRTSVRLPYPQRHGGPRREHGPLGGLEPDFDVRGDLMWRSRGPLARMSRRQWTRMPVAVWRGWFTRIRRSRMEDCEREEEASQLKYESEPWRSTTNVEGDALQGPDAVSLFRHIEDEKRRVHSEVRLQILGALMLATFLQAGIYMIRLAWSSSEHFHILNAELIGLRLGLTNSLTLAIGLATIVAALTIALTADVRDLDTMGENSRIHRAVWSDMTASITHGIAFLSLVLAIFLLFEAMASKNWQDFVLVFAVGVVTSYIANVARDWVGRSFLRVATRKREAQRINEFLDSQKFGDVPGLSSLLNLRSLRPEYIRFARKWAAVGTCLFASALLIRLTISFAWDAALMAAISIPFWYASGFLLTLAMSLMAAKFPVYRGWPYDHRFDYWQHVFMQSALPFMGLLFALAAAVSLPPLRAVLFVGLFIPILGGPLWAIVVAQQSGKGSAVFIVAAHVREVLSRRDSLCEADASDSDGRSLSS